MARREKAENTNLPVQRLFAFFCELAAHGFKLFFCVDETLFPTNARIATVRHNAIRVVNLGLDGLGEVKEAFGPVECLQGTINSRLVVIQVLIKVRGTYLPDVWDGDAMSYNAAGTVGPNGFHELICLCLASHGVGALNEDGNINCLNAGGLGGSVGSHFVNQSTAR